MPRPGCSRAAGLQPQESFVDLASAGVRLRVLIVGAGPPLVMLHGVSLAAAVWAPWLADFAGYRAILVELPGHGLSGPVAYRPGAVRDHTLRLMDDLFDSLGLATAPVVGHSLGGMFALWHAAARPGRIASLVAIGDPAVALPGATVRMPLSLLTVPVLGRAVLGTPNPRPVQRGLLGQGLTLPPPRPRLMTSSMYCASWAAAVAMPGPWPQSCMRSMASAGPGPAAS
jgi:pimeloyl-ACP methyl ester carboxylesterase